MVVIQFATCVSTRVSNKVTRHIVQCISEFFLERGACFIRGGINTIGRQIYASFTAHIECPV